jgi:amino acid transporter
MKKIVLRYGLYSGIAEFLFFVATWLFIWITKVGHEVQGYIGYISIICPLIFIYFGIRYYRDTLNGGTITFLKALQVGLLIVIIPAIAFAIVETTYVEYIDPKFYETVTAYDIEQYRKTLPPAEFAIKLKEIHAQLAMDKNPVFNFCIMILSIVSLGIIISLISSLMLFRSAKKATQAI